LDLSKGWSDFMKETPDVHYFLVEFCQNSIVWSLADFFTSKTENTIEREPCGGRFCAEKSHSRRIFTSLKNEPCPCVFFNQIIDCKTGKGFNESNIRFGIFLYNII
jgi:hypothetical protein